MKITIQSAEQLGPLVRAVRKAQGIRQDDAAGSIGVSENFLGKIERGGATVQWGKLFGVLRTWASMSSSTYRTRSPPRCRWRG